MSATRAQSSFADEDWLPVLEALVRGAQHSLNNRVAALDGAISLQELGLAPVSDSLRTFRREMNQLRLVLNVMRDLTPKLTPRREPGMMDDALMTATHLLAHLADAPQITLEPSEQSSAAEPVLLWPADRARAAVLLLSCASDAAERTSVLSARVRGGEQLVHVVVEGQFKAAEAMRSAAYQALVRFAAAESGSCAYETLGADSARITLTLPGMSRSR